MIRRLRVTARRDQEGGREMAPKEVNCVGAKGEHSASELGALIQMQRKMSEQLLLSTLRAHDQAEAAEATAKKLRASEKAVRRLTELFRATFDVHPVMSFVTDRRAIIVEANAEAAFFLRVPSEALRETPLIRFVSRSDTGQFRTEMRDMRERKSIVLRLKPRDSGAYLVKLDIVELPRRTRFLWTAQQIGPSGKPKNRDSTLSPSAFLRVASETDSAFTAWSRHQASDALEQTVRTQGVGDAMSSPRKGPSGG